MNSGLDKNQSVLCVFIFSAFLHMSSDIYGLFNQTVDVFGNLRGTAWNKRRNYRSFSKVWRSSVPSRAWCWALLTCLWWRHRSEMVTYPFWPWLRLIMRCFLEYERPILGIFSWMEWRLSWYLFLCLLIEFFPLLMLILIKNIILIKYSFLNARYFIIILIKLNIK